MLGDVAPRGFLQVLGGQKVPAEDSGSGRRELADWVASAENPLTARVMVNRMWHYHFGRGIVATTSDFGVRGTPPANPELLDWLAAKFMHEGWSVKAIHRLILLSETYQLASTNIPANAAVDPENLLHLAPEPSTSGCRVDQRFGAIDQRKSGHDTRRAAALPARTHILLSPA